MSKENITFRLDNEKKVTLDVIAAGLNHDQSYVLNQAIDLYLDVYQWQICWKRWQN
ncbi:CopG family ribbon-helix-helix protein [Nostoc sp.]|uniref:CopG family ribbon-helix-helix protein n=1 Tax=Nostoc sp. TaxID=1180 RepID=UPI002FF68D19